ncbi:MAG: hypothetical protein WBZ01_02075 [Terriglobales bacterium]|jgi:hypothetical protein
MKSKCISTVLIVALGVALAAPAKAQGGKIGYSGPVVGPIVGAVAALVVVVLVAIHYSKKRSVTGCVTSGTNGTSITDEKDRQIYALSGNTTAIKPGDRMKVQGKKVKSKGADKTLGWEAKDVTKDFGVCQP